MINITTLNKTNVTINKQKMFPFEVQGFHMKERIRKLVNNASNRVKRKLIRTACKKIVRKYKKKLIDAILNHLSPRRVCVKLKVC